MNQETNKSTTNTEGSQATFQATNAQTDASQASTQPGNSQATSAGGEFVSSYTKGQRVMALIAVGILLAFTVCDIVLALIGVPTNILMLFIVLTIFVPIVLFIFIKLLNKKNPNIHVPGEKREN